MKSHLWQGHLIEHKEWLSQLEMQESFIESTLTENFDLDRFIESCELFSLELKSESDPASLSLWSNDDFHLTWIAVVQTLEPGGAFSKRDLCGD